MNVLERLRELDRRAARLWAPNPIITQLILSTVLPKENLKVIDCGAGGGSLGEWQALDQRIIRYGFDPDPAECSRLNAAAQAANWNHIYYPICLAGKDETHRKFYLANHWGSNSLYPPDETLIGRWKQLQGRKPLSTLANVGLKQVSEIDTVCLDTWAERERVSDIDFIKLDIQGAELEVLSGGMTLLKTTLGLLVEAWFTPAYQGQPLFADIDTFLREQGFTFFAPRIYYKNQFVGRMASPVSFGRINTFREQQAAGQLVTADLLYLRDPIASADRLRLSTLKLLKLACLAEMCLQIEYAFELLTYAKDRLQRSGDDASADKIRGIVEQAERHYSKKTPLTYVFHALRIMALRGPL